MIFTEEEKISMLKAMDELIRSDDEIHQKEVEFLEAIVEEFEWDSGFLEKLENFKREDAIKAVQSLSPEKLKYFQTLLHELANSDRIINEKETQFIDRINEFISENSL